MPGLQSNTGAVSHDRAMVEALEHFCNSPEQSYEQFLSTFTYLTTENVTGEGLKVLGTDTSVGGMDGRNREVAERGVDTVDEGESHFRREQNQHALTAHLEELVLDGSVIVGRLGNGETLPSDPPVKFDNYLEDMEPEDEHLDAGCQDAFSLPGEVEDDSPVYTPSFCHHTLLELSSTANDHRAHTPQTTVECQSETEEVVPFSLDNTFDYDNVVLSHKHCIQHSTNGSS